MPDHWPEPSSRRKFLKAVLISSAAAAATGTATYVAIERVGSAPVSSFSFIGHTGSPGGSTASACVTKADDEDYVRQPSCNNRDSFYLWGLFTNLPAGSYTMTVTPTIKANGHPVCTPSPAPNPLVYNGSSSTNTNARLYELNPSKVTWNCSPPKLRNLPRATRSGGSLEKIFTTPITVTAGSDLQLQIHMENGCSGGRTVTLTVSIFQGSHTSTPFLQASTTVTIRA